MNTDFGTIYPINHETLVLPSGDAVSVRKAKLRFVKWNGEPVPDYNGKALIDYNGQPLFAELVILRILESAGWQGYWIDSFGKAGYRRELPHLSSGLRNITGSPPASKFPNGFSKLGGGWDVVAWKGESIIFAELKRTSEDQIRKTQLVWLEDRLREGADLGDFILVEWTLLEESKPTFEVCEGFWYAYQMLPGYGAPYFSPILISGVSKKGKKIELSFFNARYAEGVKDFRKSVTVVAKGEKYLVVTLDNEQKRSAVIAEMDSRWAKLTIPDYFSAEHPMLPDEDARQDYQSYLNRLYWKGFI